MPLLHLNRLRSPNRQKTAKPASARQEKPKHTWFKKNAASTAPVTDTLVVNAQPRVDVLAHAGTDVSQRAPYLSDVVRAQTALRVRRKHTALKAGGIAGGVGLLYGIVTGPFAPVVGAGCALVGAAVGAARPMKQPASFRQVRKHMFFKSGIVDSRAKSAALVAALKKGKVLNKGRGRDIASIGRLDQVLQKEGRLSARQRRHVRESLELIHQEAPHFDALSAERDRLRLAIQQLPRPYCGNQTVAPVLQALNARHSQIMLRLEPGAAGKPGVRPLTWTGAPKTPVPPALTASPKPAALRNVVTASPTPARSPLIPMPVQIREEVALRA